MKVTMRATYERLWWESDEPDTEPDTERGYTDPCNPWGGLRAEVDPALCGEEFGEWRDANADLIEFDNMWDAAEFVVDFPGGVWDYREGEYSSGTDGVEMSVTLHVNEHEEAVFAIADIIGTIAGRRLRRSA